MVKKRPLRAAVAGDQIRRSFVEADSLLFPPIVRSRRSPHLPARFRKLDDLPLDAIGRIVA
jgi:hypothetical protein